MEGETPNDRRKNFLHANTEPNNYYITLFSTFSTCQNDQTYKFNNQKHIFIAYEDSVLIIHNYQKRVLSLHYKSYISHHIIHTTHFTLHNLHFTLHTIHNTSYDTHYALHHM